MFYNVSSDLWYQYFIRNDGPQALILFMFYGGRAVFAIFCLLLNASVVYVTVKSRPLRNTCNILLALEAACGVVKDASFCFAFFVVAFGFRFINYSVCFWPMLPLYLIGSAAQPIMLLTGVDRLTCVLFPVWYKHRNKVAWFLLVLLITIFSGITDYIMIYLDFQYSSADLKLTCDTNELGQSEAMGILMRIKSLSISGLLFGIYLVMWVVVFKLNGYKNGVSAKKRKVIKSLIVLMLLNIFGVFIRLMVKYYFTIFPANVFVKRSVNTIGTFINIAVYSANAPVLYACSDEYRTHFDAHFTWLPKVLHANCTQTPVVPIPSTINPQRTSHES